MEKAQHNYLSIGDFAEASRLSRKALRLYEERHILRPAYVDPESGYRYYQPDQLATARLIRALRQIEMPLAAIQQLVAAPPEQYEALVLAYERQYSAHVEQVKHAIHSVLLTLQYKEKTMSFTAHNINLEPQLVATITRHTLVSELDKNIRTALEQLQELVQAQKGELVGAPLGIFHGQINEEENGPIEVCWPVRGQLTPQGEVALRVLAGGTAVAVDAHGDECDFPTILGAYDAAYDWIKANGHEMAEPPREVWHTAPDADAHMQIIWLYK